MDYIEAFKNLRTNNKYGRKSLHKAILMLAVIELYEQNVLTDNEIFYDEKLKSMFLKVWNRVLPKEPLFHPDAYLPFWYLQSDSFWHIIPIRGKEDILSLMRDANIKPSEAKLNDSVKCAELDDDLYFLMTIASGRSSLKRTLLETYTLLSEEQIDRLSGSVDNSVDHSLSAMNEYEQILSSTKKDDQELEIEDSRELVQQFRKLNDDLQIALNYEYFSFLKNHRSERDMLREFCPNVFALYDCITNHPVQRTDISTSFAFIYDNFLCDLKIALMSENGSMELIDKIEAAIEILRGNNEAENNPETDELIDVKDEREENEESIDNLNINEDIESNREENKKDRSIGYIYGQEDSFEEQIDNAANVQDGFKIENSTTRCHIINNNGEWVYSSSGKLIIIGNEFYRIKYTDSVFTMYLIKNDGKEGLFRDKIILNARYRSPLYDSLDKYKYLDQIKNVRIDPKTEEYHVQVENRWYGSSGYYADFEQKGEKIPGIKISNKYVDDDSTKEELTKKKEISIDEQEIEHVYLDPSGNVLYTTTSTSDNIQESDIVTENRKGKPWTEDEERKIQKLFQQGKDFETIAIIIGRTEVAIKARLAKLGLIDYDYNQENGITSSGAEVNDEEPTLEDYTIDNSFLRCSILNKKGERVFSTDGKLIKLSGKLYRFKLKSECFTLKDMKLKDGVWIMGEKKIVAYPNTELYDKIYNTEDYTNAIEDIVDRPYFKNCKLKVNGVWYLYDGNTIANQNDLNDAVEDSKKETEDKYSQFSVKIGETLKLFPSQIIGKVIKLRTDKTGHRKIVVQSEDGSIAEIYDSKYLYQKIYVKKDDSLTSKPIKKERIKREDPISNTLDKSLEDNKQPSKESSSNVVNIGDWIKTNFYNDKCQVINIENRGYSNEKLILQFKDGSQDWIINKPDLYTIVDSSSNQIVKKKEKVSDIIHRQQVTRPARIGDWIIRKSDGLIAKVVDIKGLGGGFERLILELEDGSKSGVFNNPNLFKVLQ